MDDQCLYYEQTVNRKVYVYLQTFLYAQIEKQVQMPLLRLKIQMPHLGVEQKIRSYSLLQRQPLYFCPLNHQYKSQFQMFFECLNSANTCLKTRGFVLVFLKLDKKSVYFRFQQFPGWKFRMAYWSNNISSDSTYDFGIF